MGVFFFHFWEWGERFLLHITISIHSLEFSLGMSTAVHLCLSGVLREGRSLQVSVFQVPVLKREALLLPLAPFLIVKVNVSALWDTPNPKKQNKKKKHQYMVHAQSFLTAGRKSDPF